VEVINDTHGELVRLYRCVQHHLEELCRQFKWALVSREMFRWAQLQHTDTLTDIQRAARFFYLQRLAFGGKVVGQNFGTSATTAPRINLVRLEEDLSMAHLRLSRVTIENLPWQDVMRRYDKPETLFFLDPPYWQTMGYGGAFGLQEHQQLAEAMATMQGKALLTINDHPDMHGVYGAMRATPMRTSYTVGGGDRAKEARELLYSSWR
jgi:DNA adenine methylase